MSIDHVFLPVTDLARSRAFYAAALLPLGWRESGSYEGASGPAWIPDLTGFSDGAGGSIWLRQGDGGDGWSHIGFVAPTRDLVDASYAAALEAGARDNEAPGIRAHFYPGYYASNVYDPDGHSLEFVHKS